MPTMDAVIQRVLKKITPTYWERKEIGRVLQEVKRETEKTIRRRGMSYVLAGSYLRDTWLPDKKEFDIFLLFPESTPREKLEKGGLELGKKVVTALKGKYTIAYAEHPYVRAHIRGFDVDIVPAYKVISGDKIKSAVDRTPFHNKYLAEHLTVGMAPDVRLLKRFCKGLGIYGADTKTEGLSGYLAELLIIHYGSFKGFVKKVAAWEAGRVFVDMTDHYHRHPNELKTVRERFTGQPLIVIDPVDPKRNVAAALSPAHFITLVNAAHNFLKTPSPDYFFPKQQKPSIAKLRAHFTKRKTCVLGLSFKRPEVIDDVLWPQLRKTARRLINLFSDYEFGVWGHAVFSNEREALLFFELETPVLPVVRKLHGPPVFAHANATQFRHKYRKDRMWVEEDHWVAEVARKFREPGALLAYLLKQRQRDLQESGLGSYIAQAIAKHYRLMGEKEILAMAKKNQGFARFLQRYFEHRIKL
jgi:tRNA nucleotidyltransferase (CCA-adding enzyme)